MKHTLGKSVLALLLLLTSLFLFACEGGDTPASTTGGGGETTPPASTTTAPQGGGVNPPPATTTAPQGGGVNPPPATTTAPQGGGANPPPATTTAPQGGGVNPPPSTQPQIQGITLTGAIVEYDGLPHKLQVVGNVPAGVTVSYTYNDIPKTSVTEGGTYTVKATLSGSGYQTLVLTATLVIRTSEMELATAVYGGKVYFQNPLDDGLLYTYSAGTLKKVIGKQKVSAMTVDGSGLYFVSKGLLKSSIRKITNSVGLPQTFTAQSGEYLISDGTYLYFAVNQVVDLQGKNGIYRIKLEHEEDELPTRIYTGKASYLAVLGSRLYFADGASKGKLSSISLSGGSKSTHSEDNVSDIVAYGNYLYYNVHTLTGCAIYRYDPSTATADKMTTDSGKNLTVIGDYLYYINNDLLTGNLFGTGIYRVSLTPPLLASVRPGEKVVEAEVMSLTSDGDTLYYYLRSNKHLHRFDLITQQVTDLMASFTPSDEVSLNGYVYAKEEGGEIYYLDPKDDGAIYKYNPTTRANYKVIADSCNEFWFYNGYIYYSTYIGVNYDLYRVKADGTADAERISKDRCDRLIFSGETIYYINNGATSNTVHTMKLDGTNDQKLFSDAVHWESFALLGNKLYYCTNPTIGYKHFAVYDLSTGQSSEFDYGERFVIHGGVAYVYDQKNKDLYSYNLTSNTKQVILENVEIVSLEVYSEKLFYITRDSGKAGVWQMNFDGTGNGKVKDGTYEGLFATSQGLLFYEIKITIVSDMPTAFSGTGKLLCYQNGITKQLG